MKRGKGIPKERDETKRREVCEWDGVGAGENPTILSETLYVVYYESLK